MQTTLHDTVSLLSLLWPNPSITSPSLAQHTEPLSVWPLLTSPFYLSPSLPHTLPSRFMGSHLKHLTLSLFSGPLHVLVLLWRIHLLGSFFGQLLALLQLSDTLPTTCTIRKDKGHPKGSDSPLWHLSPSEHLSYCDIVPPISLPY